MGILPFLVKLSLKGVHECVKPLICVRSILCVLELQRENNNIGRAKHKLMSLPSFSGLTYAHLHIATCTCQGCH